MSLIQKTKWEIGGSKGSRKLKALYSRTESFNIKKKGHFPRNIIYFKYKFTSKYKVRQQMGGTQWKELTQTKGEEL